MPAKMARSAPRPPSGLPEVTVAVRIALLPCRVSGKPRISKPVRESSGESRFKAVRTKSPTQDRHFDLSYTMTPSHPLVAQPHQKAIMNSAAVPNCSRQQSGEAQTIGDNL